MSTPPRSGTQAAQSSGATAARVPTWVPWAIVAFLLLAVWLIYGQTLEHPLLDYDDNGFVYDRPEITAGLTKAGFVWAWTKGPYGEWYPLATLSHMLDCQLFGLGAWGHHLTSVLLHAATSVLLFLVLLRMTGQRAVPGTDRRLVAAQASGARVAPAGPSATTSQQAVPEAAQASGARVAPARPSATTSQQAVPEAAQASGARVAPARPSATTSQQAVPEAAQASGARVAPAGPSATTLFPSAFVALVFAVHPQHVESVAWIAERRDVLSGLFFMLTLAAYLNYVQHGRSLGRYLMVTALFALGLMSKPMLVTLPPLLLLLDFWPLARLGRADDVPAWTRSIERPGILWLVLEKLPLLALAAADCLLTLRTHHAVMTVPLGWSGRIGNAAVACVSYVAQCFWPVGLAAYYPLTPGGPPAWKIASAIAILMAVSAAALIWRRKCPYLFVGWFWYLGMLTPVLGLVQLADHAMADRYMYLPGIGLYIAVAWGATRLADHFPRSRWILVAGGGATIAVLVASAFWQASFWYDDETLWRHALECTTDNYNAEIGLGVALARQGRYDEAIELYRAALTLMPDSIQARLHLGSALTRIGEFDEAMQNLGRVLELDPRNASAYHCIGNLLAFQKRSAEAQKAFEQAISLDPHDAGPHNDLGQALAQEGKTDEAQLQYEAALAVDPNFVLSHINLADLLAARGETSEAIRHYRRALEIDAQNPATREKLARLLKQDSSDPPRPSP